MGTSGGITGYTQTQSDTRYYSGSVPSDLGCMAWTHPPILSATSGTAMGVAGRLEVVRMLRVPAGTVTNIVFLLTSAGSGLTSGQCFASLYTSAGALLSSTADQAANWTTSGRKVMALTAPQAVTAGDYYVGWWYNGTTGPSLARGNLNFGTTFLNGSLASPNLLYGSADLGLTTAAPATMGAQSAGQTAWWLALS